VGDLGEAGVGEDAAAADVELANEADLSPGLGDHGVTLEGAGTAFSDKVDGGSGQGPAYPPVSEACPGDVSVHIFLAGLASDGCGAYSICWGSLLDPDRSEDCLSTGLSPSNIPEPSYLLFTSFSVRWAP